MESDHKEPPLNQHHVAPSTWRDEDTVRLTDIALEPEEQRIEHGFQSEINPPQYLPPINPPQAYLQQSYTGPYPPPGAGQVSPNHPVPGSFPQKDARMYHQQQQQPQQQQYPSGTVLYQTGTPYSPPGTSPYSQPTGAQLYPGYGTTQQMQGGTPGPQANTGSVTFVDPTLAQKPPKDYMCLSILACLFCFCPTGCAAIYFASKTKDAISEGNIPEAQARSNTTLKLIKISIAITIISATLYLLWRFVLASYILGTTRDQNRNYYDY